MVIGQRDLLSTAPEGPGADLSTGLSSPVGLTVDADGNLYVIDAGNNRVLRYPAPFAQTGDLLAVDLIIGQPDLNSNSPNGGQTAPDGQHARASERQRRVSRGARVRCARQSVGLRSGQQSRAAISGERARMPGRPTNQPPIWFSGRTISLRLLCRPMSTRSGKNYLSQPAGLAFDPEGRLFVADSANRVVVYAPPFAIGPVERAHHGRGDQPNAPLLRPHARRVDSNGHAVPPQAVFFVGSNPYVVDTGNARILGYNPFDQWPAESSAFSPPAQIGHRTGSIFNARSPIRAWRNPTRSTFRAAAESFVGGRERGLRWRRNLYGGRFGKQSRAGVSATADRATISTAATRAARTVRFPIQLAQPGSTAAKLDSAATLAPAA